MLIHVSLLNLIFMAQFQKTVETQDADPPGIFKLNFFTTKCNCVIMKV